MKTNKTEIKGEIAAMDAIWYGSRRECIKEFKELMKEALKQAKENGFEDELADSKAFNKVLDVLNYM